MITFKVKWRIHLKYQWHVFSLSSISINARIFMRESLIILKCKGNVSLNIFHQLKNKICITEIKNTSYLFSKEQDGYKLHLYEKCWVKYIMQFVTKRNYSIPLRLIVFRESSGKRCRTHNSRMSNKVSIRANGWDFSKWISPKIGPSCHSESSLSTRHRWFISMQYGNKSRLPWKQD